jgi:hypothetical protein
MEERNPKNRANLLPEIECDTAKQSVRSRKGFGLLVVSGKELHVVFLEKLLKYSVESFVVRRQF